MVRLVSGSWVAALLGLGGLAMAQDGLIVDPWKRAVAALFDEKPAAAAPADRVTVRPVGVASFPIEVAPPRAPSVVPVGPPLVPAVDPWAVVPIGPALEASPPRSFARDADSPGGHERRDWAFEIREIIDPWGKGPLAVATDPLIVDPWAHRQ